jgi:hypothetical protein
MQNINWRKEVAFAGAAAIVAFIVAAILRSNGAGKSLTASARLCAVASWIRHSTTSEPIQCSATECRCASQMRPRYLCARNRMMAAEARLLI